jgi:hypothetical protein
VPEPDREAGVHTRNERRGRRHFAGAAL